MFGIRVHGGRVLAQRFFVDVLRKHQCVGHAKAALGKRAGLIKNDGLQFSGAFERNAIANQQAVARGQGRGDGHHQRHGQTEGVRAGDHHDGHGAFDGKGKFLAHETSQIRR
jgi:hypothetical protein